MDVEKHKLIFGTKSALIKLVDGAEFVVTRKTSQATKLMDDDEPVSYTHLDVYKRQPKDRDIAMVFQNYALYPHMTVFDNMAFGLKLRNCLLYTSRCV